MKYIVTEDQDNNDKEEIFIFDEAIHHDCMAEMIGRIKDQSYGNWKRHHRVPVSAGFYDGKSCYGRSETLDLKSRPQDINLIRSRGW